MQKISRLICFPIILFLCFFLIAWFAIPVSAAEDPVSINELIDNTSKYDKQSITLTGEVIGECLERGNGCWVNFSDGGNAIGIWMTKTDAARIKVYGDYKHTGDTITVTGIFYEACPEHGGEPDIHCTRLIVEESGTVRGEIVTVEKALTATCAVAVALVLLMTYQKKVLKTDEKHEISG